MLCLHLNKLVTSQQLLLSLLHQGYSELEHPNPRPEKDEPEQSLSQLRLTLQ